MLVEKEAQRNTRIYVAGLIGLVIIVGVLWGMWWVMILRYQLDPGFLVAGMVSTILAYIAAWELRGKASNSIGLQISKMTKAESMMFVAAIIDHLKDECNTHVDYQVKQIEGKR